MRMTDKVLLGVTATLLAYEGYTLVNKERGDTISESIWDSAKKRPLIPFGFGFLMGHFFFQREDHLTVVTGESPVVSGENVKVENK